ncbi:MAG TPA: ROK family transcriptional regulator [Ignavibacteriales bacterium]|nr:ROK family transcriptional regulator [Ignavibacteriales bacterium]
MYEKNALARPAGRDINEQVVLRLIQQHKIISSSDICKITGMVPSTVFKILKELSAKSLITFSGKGESSGRGGKKPYTWTLNKDAAYVIGLDIEVGEMTSVILDFSGGVIAKRITKLDIGSTLDELADTIILVVGELMAETNITSDKVLGLGVAFAGVVDCKSGIVIMSSILPDMNFPLLEKLDRLPFPVIIENNANAAAVGLKWNGADLNRKNYMIALVEIDQHVSGLGIGIVIDGELYRGASFCAGELYPHMPTLKEIISSIRSRLFEGDILKDYISSIESIDVKLLLSAAKQGDKIAELILSIIGNIVGQTIAPAVALLNPDRLVVAGWIAEMEEVLVDSVRKAIDMNVLSMTSRALTITVDKRHYYSVAFGVAALVLEEYFRIPVVK